MIAPLRNAGAESSRDHQLDFLRGIAILMVIGQHIGFFCDLRALAEPWRSAAHILATGGWAGVDLFFTLSGFLVSGLLFREFRLRGRIDVVRFFIRRGFKIYPGFYAMILATVILRLGLGGGVDPGSLLAECLFLQSYFYGLWLHTWSLAVEEHAYIVLGIMLWVLARKRRAAADPFAVVPLAALAVILFCLAARLVYAEHFAYSSGLILQPTHLRLDGIFYGVVLGYLRYVGPERWVHLAARYRVALRVAGALAFLPAFIWVKDHTPFLYTWGLSLHGVGASCLVLSTFGAGGQVRSRLLRLVSKTGFYSYSIYLWHMPVAIWGRALLERVGVEVGANVLYPLGVLAIIFAGVVTGRLIEIPMLAIRDRFFPTRTDSKVET